MKAEDGVCPMGEVAGRCGCTVGLAKGDTVSEAREDEEGGDGSGEAAAASGGVCAGRRERFVADRGREPLRAPEGGRERGGEDLSAVPPAASVSFVSSSSPSARTGVEGGCSSRASEEDEGETSGEDENDASAAPASSAELEGEDDARGVETADGVAAISDAAPEGAAAKVNSDDADPAPLPLPAAFIAAA